MTAKLIFTIEMAIIDNAEYEAEYLEKILLNLSKTALNLLVKRISVMG